MEKCEERYIGLAKTSEYDTFEVFKNKDRIRVVPYTDRWRTPDETVKYLKEIIEAIQGTF